MNTVDEKFLSAAKEHALKIVALQQDIDYIEAEEKRLEREYTRTKAHLQSLHAKMKTLVDMWKEEICYEYCVDLKHTLDDDEF